MFCKDLLRFYQPILRNFQMEDQVVHHVFTTEIPYSELEVDPTIHAIDHAIAKKISYVAVTAIVATSIAIWKSPWGKRQRNKISEAIAAK